MLFSQSLVEAGIGVSILPEGVTHCHRRVLIFKVLQREAARSEIGIATLAFRQTPLVRQLIKIAKQLGQFE